MKRSAKKFLSAVLFLFMIFATLAAPLQQYAAESMAEQAAEIGDAAQTTEIEGIEQAAEIEDFENTGAIGAAGDPAATGEPINAGTAESAEAGECAAAGAAGAAVEITEAGAIAEAGAMEEAAAPGDTGIAGSGDLADAADATDVADAADAAVAANATGDGEPYDGLSAYLAGFADPFGAPQEQPSEDIPLFGYQAELIPEDMTALAGFPENLIALAELPEEPPAPVDKSVLAYWIQCAEGLSTGGYSYESLQPMIWSLAAARRLLADAEADQAQVDGAAAALAMSIESLAEFAPNAAKTTVWTIEQLKMALANPSAATIALGIDITAPTSPDPKLVLNHSVLIDGQGRTLNLGNYSINMESGGRLKVTDISLRSADRYGFFTAYASPPSKAGVWYAEFENIRFEGPALIGQRTASPLYGIIGGAVFYGENRLNIAGPAAVFAAVYAVDAAIDGNFSMYGNSNGIYFKSPGSSGVGAGSDAYGGFSVAPYAAACLSRGLSSAFANVNTANLVEGYERYVFNENSAFLATAGTNFAESNKCYAQTAVIHSGAAREFTVKDGARVDLISDYSLSAYPSTHGSTALSLRKPAGGSLDITVRPDAALNITAYGTNSYARDFAPVLIGSKVGPNGGTSSVLIQGSLNVYSKNGNGWYYQYIDYSTYGYDRFTVDGGSAVIYADGKAGRSTSGEYAALEHYGPASFDLEVVNGGKMTVSSNGWRAMSLAGGVLSIVPKKAITVTGYGSELTVNGGQFAIAAEGKTDFTLNALSGGKVYTRNTQDSNIYTVGKATYNVDGWGSTLDMRRTGKPADPASKDSTSLYGVIFHDAPLVGPLTINVTGGGYMYVENNFGSRAAITTQSHYRTDHSINVSGGVSKLEIVNNNTGGSAAGDTSLYPVGAVAFAANCSGNINISDGGNFLAESCSADSPTIALGSYGTSNYTGVLTLDRAGLVDIKNNANTKNVRAIALRGRNYNPAKANNDAATAFVVKSGYIAVWGVGFGPTGWQYGDMAEYWWTASVKAANNAYSPITPGDIRGTTDFALAKYGRIYAYCGSDT